MCCKLKKICHIPLKLQNLIKTFNYGKILEKKKNKENEEIEKLCNGFLDNKLIMFLDDILYYN